MKKSILAIAAAAAFFSLPQATKSQTLGTASSFVLFTSNGAVGNSGITHLTGDVGSNSGSSTGFGNVNGIMQNNNGATGAASADLLTAYNQLNSAVATMFPAPLLGNGQSLNAGIYSIAGNSTLNGTLTLNAQSNANAVFILKIQGTFSSASNAVVVLANGAKACNVFWKVEGQVSLASGTEMKGNIIANNAAIMMDSGVRLEGRALSTTGAISVDNVLAYTPVGCGSPALTGPAAPNLGSSACYALFAANGPVSNSGDTYANADIGTNVGLTTGFNALNVSGAIHPIPDGSTAASATDLLVAYNYLNALSPDIELLYPAQFGNSLVLTPHTYVMNGAATFVDTLFLDAQNTPNAKFVIQINGALSTSTYAKVSLRNGATAANVYWKIEGAVDIDDYSEFVGTIVANNGAIELGTGVMLNGRALTTDGALATTEVTVTIPVACTTAPAGPQVIGQPGSSTVCPGTSASFTVLATGTGLSYQWRKGNTVLSNTGNISGSTSATLTINPATAADNSSSYNVIVSNSTSKDTSNNATLAMRECDDPTALTEKNTGQGISFYPNPFSGSFTIGNESGLANLHVRFQNILGETVLLMDIPVQEQARVVSLPPGIYFYYVADDKQHVKSGKILSQN